MPRVNFTLTLSTHITSRLIVNGTSTYSEALLLIDEPSLGLAPALVDQVFEALESVHRSGVSMLLIEQNVTRALEIAGRAYVLEGGRTVADGPAHELREQAHIRQAYLGEAA